MRNRVVVYFAGLLLLAGIGIASAARAADDPSSGTWKLNVAKSKYSPGPGPKSSTVTIKIENGTETYSAENVDAAGNSTQGAFTAKLDGTDAPVSGIPYADTVSIKRMSSHHLVATLKKGGTVMMTVHVVIAADGMSRRLTYDGKNAEGKAEHDVLVFDKQM
jgi:hypothetical protein